jgi:hypothetical protein
LLGECFTSADLVWGSALAWAIMSGLLPALPEFTAYLQRFNTRPQWPRPGAYDEVLLAEQARSKTQHFRTGHYGCAICDSVAPELRVPVELRGLHNLRCTVSIKFERCSHHVSNRTRLPRTNGNRRSTGGSDRVSSEPGMLSKLRRKR